MIFGRLGGPVLQFTLGITASRIAECSIFDLRTTGIFDSMEKYTFLVDVSRAFRSDWHSGERTNATCK